MNNLLQDAIELHKEKFKLELDSMNDHILKIDRLIKVKALELKTSIRIIFRENYTDKDEYTISYGSDVYEYELSSLLYSDMIGCKIKNHYSEKYNEFNVYYGETTRIIVIDWSKAIKRKLILNCESESGDND